MTDLSIANRSDCFLRVVLDDGSLVNKDILFGVVPVDKAVARLDVEPLNGSRHFGCDDFLLLLHLLLFLTSLVVFVGWLGLRGSLKM